MGFAQALAIVPGVSRSGATISAGLFTGLDRVSATRFSFLLGIPITAGAILKVLVSNSALTQINNQTGIFVTGVLTAFVTGLFAIRFMLNYLGKHSLAVFAYYRFIVAALVLLALVLF
jgi:undecaprenyl-diphosphatase